ncbi:glycerol-3-phosphate 1-O-acyltransferase PlsY [Dehalococcoidia bacterium]|nr:glycerol-3-phosphate 1-O-acyltransferase PlsY [Dehalococcoidia bacterium]
MNDSPSLLAAVLIICSAYLVGSIPFGLLIGKIIKGIDIRDYGSGSTGATNLMRICGARLGVSALLLDMGKSVIPMVTVIYVLDVANWVHAFTGIAVICGHSWPIYIKFKGGKGIASGWAALFILSPISGLIATAAGLPIIAITRYVSLGSIAGSTVGCASLVFLSLHGFDNIIKLPSSYFFYAIVGWIVTISLHKQNMNRLINGTESKIGTRI